MGTLKPNKVGLVVGVLAGGWHFLWAILVATGSAQSVINFIFWLHFITPIYVITPFSAGRALVLIIVTASLGFAIGYIFGLLWNWIQR